MPSVPLRPAKIAVARNGVGAYIFQCRKMVFHYCERSGSSQGMIEYLKNGLVQFARKNPQIEIVVKPRPSKHPVIRGIYLNGNDKVICVRNLDTATIAEKVHQIRDSSGKKADKRFKKPVLSTTESVRGIWSPFHTKQHVI
ncbi:5154_t:CDS:2 [Paraglomus brasilianum]|uniref:Large ribosomal subunit protein mL43 n=1 Tax=Paraglomus brasilianum TaxID=144538 RepID=A0A9N9GE56_9GLOM|nr:5154_t:CDS:2 [Paraglomus brasilianum]